MAIEIPESLRKLAEDTIKSVFDKNFPAPDQKPLHDWYEDDGWDDVVMSIQGGCVDLKSLASDYFHDYEITDDLGSEDIEITDQMRLSYARSLLAKRLEESDDGIQAVELKVSSLPSVFLDCFIHGQGQYGDEVYWGKAYKSAQEVLDIYKNNWVMDSRDVSDEDLLKLWNRE